MTEPKRDPAEVVASWIRLIVDPEKPFEIRALGCGKFNRVVSGYFDAAHSIDAAREALRLSRDGANGVYFTLNPLVEETIARRCNRVDFSSKDFRQSTDSDVDYRRWMLIDCDPKRTAGVSSTNEEHARSVATAKAIFDHLSEKGWPAPIVANSGNGTHLLYRIRVPTVDESLIKRCLKSLAARFNSDQVDVDTSVFNPSRICKLYGTVGRKGDSTPDRPHRRSGLKNIPSEIETVSIELLKQLASETPEEKKSDRPKKLPKNSNTERCREYMKSVDPSIQGQFGSNDAYRAACLIHVDWELSFDYGYPILQEFNERCEPPWSEDELMHKWESAEKHPGPYGRLSRGGDSRPTYVELGANLEFLPMDESNSEASEQCPFEADSQLDLDSLSFTEDVPSLIAVSQSNQQASVQQRLQIEIRDNEEYRTNDDAVTAIARDRDLYSRGGRLVKVINEDTSTAISILATPTIRERLTKHAEFCKTKVLADGTVVQTFCNPPEWCYKAVESRGQWAGVPPLKGIIESPTLRPDGSIVSTPGYDQQTKLYYSPRQHVELDVDDSPSFGDAIEAVATLLDLVSDFPFDSREHQSAWVAFLLTMISHNSFSGPAPLFLVDANDRGCGKGMVVDIACLIALGRVPARMTLPRNDDEIRKKIMSIALSSQPVSFFDNVDSRLGCAEFDAAITSDQWSDRLLGGNEMKSVPLTTTWVATGNNVQITGDMVRRICHCRMKTPLEDPSQRADFKYPRIIDHVKQNRSKYLSAAFTILRGFISSGRPTMNLATWGSFENWSDLVRDAIVWAGLTDPGDTRKNLSETSDASMAGIAELIHCFHTEGTQIGLDPFGHGITARDIIRITEDFPTLHSVAHEAVHEICNPRPGQSPNPRILATHLRKFRDKNIKGRVLKCVRGHNNTLKWAVEKIINSSDVPSESIHIDEENNHSELKDETIQDILTGGFI